MGSGDGVKTCKLKSGKNLLGKVLYVYIYLHGHTCLGIFSKIYYIGRNQMFILSNINKV